MPAAHGMRSRFFGSGRARVVSLLLLVMLFGAPIAWSQRQRFMLEPNVPYDGRYTFVRLRYTQGYRMAWSADYPQMERNFMTILGDLSTLRLHKKASNVHVLDDPALAGENSIRLLRRLRTEDAQVAIVNTKTLVGMTHPATPLAKAEYLGIYEDNDPSKRLQVIINYNNDIGDYMEWSGEGWYPVNFSNDAYKFATNYVMYGLTH